MCGGWHHMSYNSLIQYPRAREYIFILCERHPFYRNVMLVPKSLNNSTYFEQRQKLGTN